MLGGQGASGDWWSWGRGQASPMRLPNSLCMPEAVLLTTNEHVSPPLTLEHEDSNVVGPRSEDVWEQRRGKLSFWGENLMSRGTQLRKDPWLTQGLAGVGGDNLPVQPSTDSLAARLGTKGPEACAHVGLNYST